MAPAGYGTGQMLRPLYMGQMLRPLYIRPGHRDVPRALLPPSRASSQRTGSPRLQSGEAQVPGYAMWTRRRALSACRHAESARLKATPTAWVCMRRSSWSGWWHQFRWACRRWCGVGAAELLLGSGLVCGSTSGRTV